MPTQLIKNKKKAQRLKFLQARRSLSPDVRQEYSKAIENFIYQDEDFQNSQTVMAFMAMADEVNLDNLISRSLEMGKNICIPHVVNPQEGIMIAAKITNYHDLIRGEYHILTVNPDNLVEVAPEEIDLVLVPGVAFSKKGHRLGMGAGYYDIFLGQIPQVKTMAPIFSCQLAEELVYEPHDILVAKICTERGVVKCDRNHC